jgi:hypothetical protein
MVHITYPHVCIADTINIIDIDILLHMQSQRVLVILKEFGKSSGEDIYFLSFGENKFTGISTHPGGPEHATFLLGKELLMEDYGFSWGLRFYIE